MDLPLEYLVVLIKLALSSPMLTNILLFVLTFSVRGFRPRVRKLEEISLNHERRLTVLEHH